MTDYMLIPFTQYLLPDGRSKDVKFECGDVEVFNKAQALLKEGYFFDAEMLSTGIVSFTCEFGEEIVSIELSENGPQVIEKIAALVNTAYALMEETNG